MVLGFQYHKLWLLTYGNFPECTVSGRKAQESCRNKQMTGCCKEASSSLQHDASL